MEPELPGSVPRPPCLSVCLQPAKATGKGHGAGHTARCLCSAPAATQLFVHLKRGHRRVFIPLLSYAIQMFILPAVQAKASLMPKEVQGGCFWSVILKDHRNYPVSINVRIKPVKTSTKHLNCRVSFKLLSHLKVCATHVSVLCCWVLGLYLPFLSYHSHSASTFQQMPAPLTFTSALWPPVIKRPPPSATPIPWSPISKAGPFPCTDEEVEALRGRNVERRYQGIVRWRSHEGHGSLGGWAMSRGAWTAEAGLSHRPSVLQSASQCCSAEAQTAIRQPLTQEFFFLSHLSLSKALWWCCWVFLCISVPACVW